MKSQLLFSLLACLGCTAVGFAQSPGEGTTIFSDSFNDGVISSRDWTHAGDSVIEEGGVMKVATTVTDKGGSLESRWIDVGPQEVLVISRRTRVRYGNEYFAGNFSVTFEHAPEMRYGVSYSNYKYNQQGECPRRGFFLFRDGANPHACKAEKDVMRIDPVWDAWFEERLVFNFPDNMLVYSVNGKEQAALAIRALPPSKQRRIKLSFNAWGWWTGHYHHFDDLVLSRGDGSSNPRTTESRAPEAPPPAPRRALTLAQEAESENQKFWETLFAKCGDSYFGEVAPGLSQMRVITFSVVPQELTELDRENGYEWRGQGIMQFNRRRIVTFGRWSDWVSPREDWMTGGKLPAVLQKKRGVWSAVYSPFDRNIIAKRPTCERMAQIQEQQ